MRYTVSSDMHTPLVDAVCQTLRGAGHTVEYFGPAAGAPDADWPAVTIAAAEQVADGRAAGAVVMCWTGTGASIAANKVPGIRCALVGDAETARGARRWNDANVMALSLRRTTPHLFEEIWATWSAGAPDETPWNAAQLEAVARLDTRPRSGG